MGGGIRMLAALCIRMVCILGDWKCERYIVVLSNARATHVINSG
jgi:hypothetical protein